MTVDFIGQRNLRDLLEERAARYPDNTALVCEDASGKVVEFSYQQFINDVQRTARGFASLGIDKGDAVVVHLANCAEFVLSWFGLAWIGAVMVPTNTANTTKELSHVVSHSGAVAAVTSPDYLDLFRGVQRDFPALRDLVLARTRGPEAGTTLLADLLDATGAPPRPAIDSEDVVEMIFTSGTTSLPKAVLLTHANHLWSGERASRAIDVRTEDRCLTALPAFHVNAQSTTILAAFNVGATCVLLEEYRASKFWSQIIAHDATVTSLVAMQARTLLAQPPSPDDSRHRLRRVFYAINVTDSEKKEFERRFDVELINGYGLSEAMTIVTMAPIHGDRRWPSIGLPTPDRTVRIVDGNGEDVSVGQTGEIIVAGVQGRTLMKGYFKDPKATDATLRDGWLYTGDNGYLDERGYVYFFDRKKDVIKRAGENVSASEVEFVLADHPLVNEAAVIGVPDDIRDEAVKAYVVPAEDAQLTASDVQAYCRERLASFKVPTIVEIRESLPKTSIGKIEKKTLRAESGEG
ncbi:MAG: AMP-binding protein [Streptosporangiales bacterium]|nr:AMP-binding protein [Streptosporangiales bacterium]